MLVLRGEETKQKLVRTPTLSPTVSPSRAKFFRML